MKDWDRDLVTSIMLRIGVVVSIFLISTGLVLIMIRGGADGYTLQQISTFTSTQVTSSALNLKDIFPGVLNLDGLYFVALGLWVLIFTPVSVVFVALLDFIKSRNYTYVLMSIYVLSMLIVAIFIL